MYLSIIFSCVLSYSAMAEKGVNCNTLAQWSNGNPQVNLHHVFCGEVNKKGNAVGYHSNPNGQTPTTYKSHNGGDASNKAGVYVWDKISLTLKGKTLVKPLSSMFPNHCSQMQIIKSIQYSSNVSKKSCTSPSWAQCAPSAPSSGDLSSYCLGDNKKALTIATALNSGKVNTGFPIYTKD